MRDSAHSLWRGIAGICKELFASAGEASTRDGAQVGSIDVESCTPCSPVSRSSVRTTIVPFWSADAESPDCQEEQESKKETGQSVRGSFGPAKNVDTPTDAEIVSSL